MISRLATVLCEAVILVLKNISSHLKLENFTMIPTWQQNYALWYEVPYHNYCKDYDIHNLDSCFVASLRIYKIEWLFYYASLII